MRQNQTAIDQYIADTFAEEDALLKRVAAEGERRFSGMQVSAAEGKWLHCLVAMLHPICVVEVGSFVGYSTIWMARALPAGGQLITCEKNPEHAALTRAHCAEATLPVTVMEGDAEEHLAALQQPIDLLFIDGEKRSYMRYLDAALPHLRSGSVVVGDNTLLFGAMVGQPQTQVSDEAIAVMRAFNARLDNGSEFCGVMLPTAEGMTVAIKR